MISDHLQKHALFIVNPISGIGRQKNVDKLVGKYFDKEKYTSEIVYTGAPGDATTISRQAAADGVDIVVAVGGDGTVNEIATGLVGTETAMAIVPAGSGNEIGRAHV